MNRNNFTKKKKTINAEMFLLVIVLMMTFSISVYATSGSSAEEYDIYINGSGKNVTSDEAVRSEDYEYDPGVAQGPIIFALSVDMNISQEGVDLIKSFEGFKGYAYKAHSSETYYTIGYGHYGPDVYVGMTMSEKEAERLLISDLAKYVGYVNAFLNKYGIIVNQNQFDALTSFTYNVGNVWVSYDTFQLKTYLINGISNYTDAQITTAFTNWNKAGGEVLAGLTTRRKKEAALFLSGSTKPENISSVWTANSTYPAGSMVTVQWTASNRATSYWIDGWCTYADGHGVHFLNGSVGNVLSHDMQLNDAGDYTIYVRPLNESGGGDTTACNFKVVTLPQLNVTVLPDDFWGKIQNNMSGTYLSDYLGEEARFFGETSTHMKEWHFVKNANGTYTIYPKNFDGTAALDCYLAVGDTNADIRIIDVNGSSAQQWYIETKDGLYYFRPACSKNYYIDLMNGSSEDNVPARTNLLNTDGGEGFRIIPSLEKAVLPDVFIAQIQNNVSKTYLTNYQDADAVFYNSSTLEHTQTWYFVKNSNGTYRISPTSNPNGASLECQGNGTSAENICVNAQNNSAAQQWIIETRDGLYYFRPVCSDWYYLDLENASSADGVSAKTHLFNTQGGEGYNLKRQMTVDQSYSDDFYAYIVSCDKNVTWWRHTENVNGELRVTPTGADGNNAAQIWHFTKNEMGMYCITNCYDGTMLSGDGANVLFSKSNNAQRNGWYICGGTYCNILLNGKYGRVLTLKDNDPSDGNLLIMDKYDEKSGQEYSVYVISGYQKPERPEVPVLSYENGTLRWPEKIAEKLDKRSYVLKIYEDGGLYQEITDIKTNSYEMDLPDGTYTATVTAINTSYKDYYTEGPELEFTVANTPSVLLEKDGGMLTATIVHPEKVVAHGIVAGETDSVTLETPGRTRIVFEETDENNRFALDVSSLNGYCFKAYIIYADENGQERVIYSSAVFGE